MYTLVYELFDEVKTEYFNNLDNLAKFVYDMDDEYGEDFVVLKSEKEGG